MVFRHYYYYYLHFFSFVCLRLAEIQNEITWKMCGKSKEPLNYIFWVLLQLKWFVCEWVMVIIYSILLVYLIVTKHFTALRDDQTTARSINKHNVISFFILIPFGIRRLVYLFGIYYILMWLVQKIVSNNWCVYIHRTQHKPFVMTALRYFHFHSHWHFVSNQFTSAFLQLT